MKIKYRIAILLLAIVCLSTLPALSADLSQAGSSTYSSLRGCFAGSNGWMLLVDDATKDKLQNMTPTEIQELKQMKLQEFDNMTPFQIEALRLKNMKDKDNMTLTEQEGYRSMRNADGSKGANSWHDTRRLWLFPLMLMNDLSFEKMNNMTSAEIRDLKQKKMQELNNMTLAEMKDLRQKKMQELNNMTLGELREQRRASLNMAGHFKGFDSPNGPEFRRKDARWHCMCHGRQ
ncbi:MAG: hypothetical protein LUQ38_12240 [Methanotrichaceae archaeon]|nr:hypothetical protein [Methanotrichaceae archaeon]